MDNLLHTLLQAAPDERWLFQSDKVYTVLTVVLLIWAGIVGYLFFMHRRVSQVEGQVRKLHKASFDPDGIHQDKGKGDRA